MPASFPRQLAIEMLDRLPADHPQAIRSREDLQRINRFIGSAGIIERELAQSETAPARIIELGASDGSLMLRVAMRLARFWTGVHVTLLDREDLVDADTRNGFARIGWSLDVHRTSIENWIVREPAEESQNVAQIVIANLFIHHFDAMRIRELFAALAMRTNLFVACEPRRGRFPLLASRMVGLLGANVVTREDAVLSVRAGFSGNELSALWPSCGKEWRLEERPAGMFSHLFVARRR